MSRRDLKSNIAMTKALFDTCGMAYSNCYEKLIIDSLQEVGDQPVTSLHCQRHILSFLGIEMPLSLIDQCLKNLCSENLLEERDHIYYVNTGKLPNKFLATDAAFFKESLSEFSNAFIKFARANYDTDLNLDQAEQVIFHFFAKNYLAFHDGDYDFTEAFSLATEFRQYILADFISECYKTNSSNVQTLDSLVKSISLLNFLFAKKNEDGLPNTVVFLDTVQVLRYLGYSSNPLVESATCFIDQLRESRINILLFYDTFREIEGIISGALNFIISGDESLSFEVGNYFRKNNISASDIEWIKLNLKDIISDCGIEIVDRPEIDLSDYFDHASLRDFLSWYRNDGAKWHDINVVQSVFGLRKGRLELEFQSEQFIFTTENNRLASDLYFFFKDHYGAHDLPVCMTSSSLGSLIFATRKQIRSEFPRISLLANCYAAMRFPPEFWNAYQSELKRLEYEKRVNAENLARMRYDFEVLKSSWIQLASATNGLMPYST